MGSEQCFSQNRGTDSSSSVSRTGAPPQAPCQLWQAHLTPQVFLVTHHQPGVDPLVPWGSGRDTQACSFLHHPLLPRLHLWHSGTPHLCRHWPMARELSATRPLWPEG